jgi:hypothetical protein
MKNNLNDSKFSRIKVKDPVINIRVNFLDHFRKFRTDEIVAQKEMHSYFVDTFNMDNLKRAKLNKKRAYDTLMRLAFSPKLDMEKYCTAVLRYACCSTDIKNCIVRNPNIDMYCELNINVDRNARSFGIALEYNKINYIDSFNLVGKLSTGVEMTLPSKLQFLSDEELSFINHIRQLANYQGQSPLKFTSSELNELSKEHLHDAEVIRDRELELLLRLRSFGLVNLFWNFEESRFEITICDSELYNNLIVDVSNDQIDDLDFLSA